MKSTIGLLVLAVVVVTMTVFAVFTAQPPKEEKESKVVDEVRHEAHQKGKAQVILVLKEEGGSYTVVQDAVLGELKGTKFKLLSKSEMYQMSLEVEPYALDILENSINVESVTLNRAARVHLSQSVPIGR